MGMKMIIRTGAINELKVENRKEREECRGFEKMGEKGWQTTD